VIVLFALGVPEGSPLLAPEVRMLTAALFPLPDDISCTAAVWRGLKAESTIIAETFGAAMPAYGAVSNIAFMARSVTQSILFLQSLIAGRDELANSSSVGIFQARRFSCKEGSRQEQKHCNGYYHCL
jgi:hypothetical protein